MPHLLFLQPLSLNLGKSPTRSTCASVQRHRVALCHKPVKVEHRKPSIPLLSRPEAVLAAPIAALLLLSNHLVEAARNTWNVARKRASKNTSSRRLDAQLQRRERERAYLHSAVLATEATLSNTRSFLETAERRQKFAEEKLTELAISKEEVDAVENSTRKKWAEVSRMETLLYKEREEVDKLRGEVERLGDKFEEVENQLHVNGEIHIGEGAGRGEGRGNTELQERAMEEEQILKERSTQLEVVPLEAVSATIARDLTEVKRKRGRPRKTASAPTDPSKPKRPRGRPRKAPLEPIDTESPKPRGRPRKVVSSAANGVDLPKRKRGRPRKDAELVP